MIDNDWLEYVSDEFKKPYYKDLYNFVKEEYSTHVIYPPAYDIFNEEKYIQETKSLSLINDSFKKILVVRQSAPITHDEKGITTIGIIDFLLNEKSLDL